MVDAHRADAGTPAMPQNASSGGKPAVLVIEDERALAEEIRYELEAEGYPVALAETRAEGLRVARESGMRRDKASTRAVSSRSSNGLTR